MVGKAYTVCLERSSENKLRRSISHCGMTKWSMFNYLSSQISGLFNLVLRAFREGRRPVSEHVFKETWRAVLFQWKDKVLALVVRTQSCLFAESSAGCHAAAGFPPWDRFPCRAIALVTSTLSRVKARYGESPLRYPALAWRGLRTRGAKAEVLKTKPISRLQEKRRGMQNLQINGYFKVPDWVPLFPRPTKGPGGLWREHAFP